MSVINIAKIFNEFEFNTGFFLRLSASTFVSITNIRKLMGLALTNIPDFAYSLQAKTIIIRCRTHIITRLKQASQTQYKTRYDSCTIPRCMTNNEVPLRFHTRHPQDYARWDVRRRYLLGLCFVLVRCERYFFGSVTCHSMPWYATLCSAMFFASYGVARGIWA